MKKLLCAVFAAITIGILVNLYISNIKPNTAPGNECSRTYVFGEVDGYVACFEKGESKPFLITKKRVSELPELDREMLSGGIEVHGARAVSRGLEDYCS